MPVRKRQASSGARRCTLGPVKSTPRPTPRKSEHLPALLSVQSRLLVDPADLEASGFEGLVRPVENAPPERTSRAATCLRARRRPRRAGRFPHRGRERECQATLKSPRSPYLDNLDLVIGEDVEPVLPSQRRIPSWPCRSDPSTADDPRDGLHVLVHQSHKSIKIASVHRVNSSMKKLYVLLRHRPRSIS